MIYKGLQKTFLLLFQYINEIFFLVTKFLSFNFTFYPLFKVTFQFIDFPMLQLVLELKSKIMTNTNFSESLLENFPILTVLSKP